MSFDQDTGNGAAARKRSAMPHRRKCSMVRTLTVLHLGRAWLTSSRGSITRQLTPRRPSSTAAARPTGPPPATSTWTERGSDVRGLTVPILSRPQGAFGREGQLAQVQGVPEGVVVDAVPGAPGDTGLDERHGREELGEARHVRRRTVPQR